MTRREQMPSVQLVLGIAFLESLVFSLIAGVSAYAGSGFAWPPTMTVLATLVGTTVAGFLAHLGKRLPAISKYARMPWTLNGGD